MCSLHGDAGEIGGASLVNGGSQPHGIDEDESFALFELLSVLTLLLVVVLVFRQLCPVKFAGILRLCGFEEQVPAVRYAAVNEISEMQTMDAVEDATEGVTLNAVHPVVS